MFSGADFQLDMVAPFQLVFATTQSRLPIPFNVTDDNILEADERFQLIISVPSGNQPTGYSIGSVGSTSVLIQDNESRYCSLERKGKEI